MQLRREGHAFLVDQAKLRRTTTYTEMEAVLVRRTGLPGFDFALENERAAMGQLLGDITEQTFPTTNVMISALVAYLNENDAGPGFYTLAKKLKKLPGNTTQQQKWEFWVTEVQRVHDYYA